MELLDAPTAQQDAALARLAAAGLTWVRLRAGWELLEPTPGMYAWEALDRLIDAVQRAGLEPLVVIDGSPPWARAPRDSNNPNDPAPPAEPATLARFAGLLATRYGDRVHLWQVWDEPNIAPNWGNRQIDPVGYAQLLRAVAASLRAADPDAFILTAALAPTRDRGHLAIDEVHFLHKMIAAGAAGSFDAVALQPFGFGDGPVHARQSLQRLNFQRLAVVRRALVTAGLAELPVWAVRMGWNVRLDSTWGTVLPDHRLRFVEEARLAAGGWPWLLGMGWAIDQPAAPESDPAWGFALDEPLLAAWTGPLPEPTAAPPAGLPPGAQLGLWLGALAATVTLGVRELKRLPWSAWRAQYRALPFWLRLGLWAGAALGYYLAVWPPLIGLWLGALALLATAEPLWALACAAALLPFTFFHKELTLPDGLAPGGRLTLSPTVAAALALLPATVSALRRALSGLTLRSAPARLLWSDWLAAGWLAIALPSAAAVWQWSAYGQALVEVVLTPLLLYTALRLFARETRSALLVSLALAGGGLLVALLGLAKWFAGAGVEVDGVLRLVGPHYSPNHSALALTRALILGAGLLMAVWSAGRNFLAVALLSMAGALLLTASRGALLLGLPAGGAALLLLWLLRAQGAFGPRLRALANRRGVRLVLLAAPFLLAAATVVGETRMLNVATVDSRLLLWQAALQVWRANPLFGVGPGGFAWSYPAWLAPGSAIETNLLHPHNLWLETATGWGVAGLFWLAAFVVLWATTAAGALQASTRQQQAMLIGLTAALVAAMAHGLVDAFLSLPDLAGWLLVALGLFVAAAHAKSA